MPFIDDKATAVNNPQYLSKAYMCNMKYINIYIRFKAFDIARCLQYPIFIYKLDHHEETYIYISKYFTIIT